MRRALFVTEKFCEGHPDFGWTNNFHQTFGTFQQAKPEWNFNTIHIDEAFVTYGIHIDEILPKYCLHHAIDVVFFCLLGDSNLNPTQKSFDLLKSLGVKMCFIWPDCGPGWAINTMYSLQSVADLQVSWDQASSEFHDLLPPLPNFIKLWAPQDETLYYPALSYSYEVTFLGSRYYPLRQNLLEELTQRMPRQLHVAGGQREGKLSPAEYARQIRESKIILNLPHHPLGFWQLKSRVMEALASRCLVIELQNPATSQLLEPSKDYVAASSIEDMVDRANFFLNHPELADKIARNGYETYLAKYTARHYWGTIFHHLKYE